MKTMRSEVTQSAPSLRGRAGRAQTAVRNTLTLAAAGAAVALSSLGGQASGEAQTVSVNACQLLASVVQHDVVIHHDLTLHHFIQNGPGWRCEFTSKRRRDGDVGVGAAPLLLEWAVGERSANKRA